MQFRRTSRPSVSINIAPLVDVVFLLLIFFAVSTTFLETAGLKLELPTSSSTAKRQLEDLTVVIDAEGHLSFDGRELNEDELTDALRQALAEADSKIVVLRADTATSHGQVVRIMDRIREAGAEGMTVAARSAGSE